MPTAKVPIPMTTQVVSPVMNEPFNTPIPCVNQIAPTAMNIRPKIDRDHIYPNLGEQLAPIYC